MRKKMAAFQRLAVLALVWVLAAFYAVQAVGAVLLHRKLDHEVAQMHQQYHAALQGYSGELAQGDRLRNDKQYQIDILKKHFGYSERDETPVIVMPPQD